MRYYLGNRYAFGNSFLYTKSSRISRIKREVILGGFTTYDTKHSMFLAKRIEHKFRNT